ncbi:hypothetical protein Gohar_006999 [Gossypium harknessii]|uniref:Uncharacterized protein n=1 Tax=Gossypium harknessii TaxID=34285 RepID=A0A7J9GF75_9ROSI|nr:hypothetical protein [Gossypium harknessii]
MSWLRRNFGGLDEDSTEVERERHARAYILQIIGECIIEEFFVNPNIWHVNVPLVVYATIEMHELDRAIVVPKLTLEYMPWFRIHGKRYLYGKEARGLQLHTRRPQRASIHPNTDEASPSSATTQEPTPTVVLSMVVPPTTSYIPPHFSTSTSMPSFIFGASSPMYYTTMPSTFSTTTTYRLSMFQASNESPLIMPSVYGTLHSYTQFPFATQTPLRSLFYQSGSSSQPPILSPEDAR